MTDTDKLVKAFAKAGLVLQIADKPFGITGNGSEKVFMIDIRRSFPGGNQRAEYFVIYPGSKDNIISVQGISRSLSQLVLTVKEPRHSYEELIPKLMADSAKARAKERPKDFQVLYDLEGGGVKIRRWTPGGTRHFLLGRDERQLFIAQLAKPASTVKQAHENLKGTRLITAEGRHQGKTIRQGEWFFIPATPEQIKAIEEGLKKNRLFIRSKTTIGSVLGRRGKPHTADELVTVPGEILEHGFSVRRRPEVFVRGKIRHPDHYTSTLPNWHLVIGNAERQSDGSLAGGRWID